LMNCTPTGMLYYCCIFQGFVEVCLCCNLWATGIANFRVLPKVHDSLEALLEWKLVFAINVANFFRAVFLLALPVGEELIHDQRLFGLRGGGMCQGSAVSGVLCLGSAWGAASMHGAALREEGRGLAEQWPSVLVFSLSACVNFLLSCVWVLSMWIEGQGLRRASLPLHALPSRGAQGRRELVDVTFGLLKSPLEVGSVCVICLDDLSLGCSVGRLECSHVFHAGCIRTWVRESSRWAVACPLRCSATSRPGSILVSL